MQYRFLKCTIDDLTDSGENEAQEDLQEMVELGYALVQVTTIDADSVLLTLELLEDSEDDDDADDDDEEDEEAD